ncbi:MAG: M20 aminoacylase family protein [Pseudomonadota bacterium]
MNRFAEMQDEIAGWRRHLHAHPELGFEVHKTARFVADKLREFGCDEVVEGIGRTGIVGLIHGRHSASGRVVGMRADMDALPIPEIGTADWKSTVPENMHACGHDGHTAMLMGAAKYMAETRNFDGTVAVIFQPAEEDGGGGREMVNDGMMERFGIQEVYGMHNRPGLAVGAFAIRPGPLMAAADEFTIHVEGKGGHAARPHAAVDTTLIGSQIVVSLHSVVSRNVDPLDQAVLSICQFETDGSAHNVIPQTARLRGTARTYRPEVRDLIEERMADVIRGTADAMGGTARLDYTRDYPPVVNHIEETIKAGDIAAEIVSPDRVDRDTAPVMGGEDFSFMLEARPGAFIFVGNGDTAPLHHPEYDFNDEIIPIGCSYWSRLAEKLMPAGPTL